MVILLISHGNLSLEFANSAEMIIGEIKDVYTMGLQPGEPLTDFRAAVKSFFIEHENNGEDIIVLSDILCGTPFNVVTDLSREHTIQHISGMNLATVLETVNCMGETAEKAKEIVLSSANGSIVDVNLLIEKSKAN